MVKQIALVVDDSPEICEIFEMAFACAGFETYSVNNAKEAIEFLSNNHVDIMTLDNDMPGMSGLQTLRFIKETHIADETKIIIATANDSILFDTDDIHLADLTIMKPVGFKQLIALATRLVSSAEV